MQIHMPLKSNDHSILESNQTLLTKVLLERVNPSGWPISLDDLPLALDIIAGVIVFIFIFKASFCRIGIKPSIFVL